jgi:hypothetical protein
VATQLAHDCQIGQLKLKIEERDDDLAFDRQRIIYDGHVLKDDATIASAGVTKPGFVVLSRVPEHKVRRGASSLKEGSGPYLGTCISVQGKSQGPSLCSCSFVSSAWDMASET